MSEVSLWATGDNEIESYRLLWLPSFTHPVSVSLIKTGSNKLLIVKELNGKGGYEPGQLIVNRTRQLTEEEWNRFMNLLQKASYWKLPTVGGNRGLDGSECILEGRKNGRYHIVDRWSLFNDSFSDCCVYLLELSGLDLKGNSN